MDDKMKWWESSVDEICVGLFVAVIAGMAIIYLPEKGDIVAVAAISAMGTYLGSKTRK